jgi:quinoprotein glucose dehydrogenase
LIDVLGEFKDVNFAPDLVKLLQSQRQNEDTFSATVRAASHIGTREITGTLVALVSKESLTTPQRIEVVTALGDLKTPEALAALKPLVSKSDRSLRLAAQRAVIKIGGKAALQIVRELLGASSTELRREAIIALGQSHDREAVPDLLAAWKAPETREAALTALTELNDLRALDAYLDGLADSNPNLRKRCRNSVIAIRGNALSTIEDRTQKLPTPVLDELRLVYHDDSAAKKGPLFANSKTLPEIEDYARFAMETPGDAVAGERIFFDESGVACFKCHAVSGRGAAIGPDLTLIGIQFPRKDLIEHVLEPSKVVREGYQQWIIETRDGENYIGLIQSETAESVRLIGADGAAQSIPKNQITSRTASSLSLMPSGLQVGLSLKQFADLIAFLESRRSDPRQRGDNAPPLVK